MRSPSRSRRAAAAGSLAIILMLPFSAAAQTGSASPAISPNGSAAPGPADRCAGWHTTPADLASRHTAAVDIEAVPTTCTLSSATLEELGDAGSIFDILGISTAYAVPDEAGDAMALNGAEPASPVYDLDPLVNIFFGRTNEMKRREWLALADALASASPVIFGLPVKRLLPDGGAIELTYIRGAVPDSTKPHSFEIGFMGTDASKTVPATLIDVDPLAGVRRLVSLYLYQQEGKQRTFVGVTDFGSKKRGLDGQTQFYNAPARAFAVLLPDGVVMGYPASFDPVGMRPMIWDNTTNVFDMGHAPDGPMAFIPSSGSAPAVLDGAALFVDQMPTSVEGVVINGGSPQTIDGKARHGLMVNSRMFDPLSPPVLDVVFKVDGDRWQLDSVPAVVDRTFFTYNWPIPGRGDYAYQDMQLRLPFVTTTVPSADAQAQPAVVDEFARVLGGYRFNVDRREGIYNPPFTATTVEELAREMILRIGVDPRD